MQESIKNIDTYYTLWNSIFDTALEFQETDWIEFEKF